MTDEITPLHNFDEASLDAAFSALAEEVRSTDKHDSEAFRLHWLGRKQGRLKLISDAWLKQARANVKIAFKPEAFQ